MSDNIEQNLLDLSALNPPAQKLKLPSGDVVDVQPPALESVLRLGFLGRKLSEATTITDDEIVALVAETKKEIIKVIPELEGIHLNITQYTTLIKLISDMGAPPQVAALADGGVTPVESPKVS